MNDFLQSLRNGNHKRFDGSRKPYSNYSNKGNDRPRGKDNRNDFNHRTFSKEVFPVLKQVLEGISENHKRLADTGERRALAEERKADALESIAKHLNCLVGAEDIPPTAGDADDVARQAGTVPVPQQATPETPVSSSDDSEDKNALDIILEMRKDKISYEKIAAFLMSENIPTFSGKGKWRGQMVSRIYQQNS